MRHLEHVAFVKMDMVLVEPTQWKLVPSKFFSRSTSHLRPTALRSPHRDVVGFPKRELNLLAEIGFTAAHAVQFLSRKFANSLPVLVTSSSCCLRRDRSAM